MAEAVTEYTQTITKRRRYRTKFQWILCDWSLLFCNTYSKGLVSDYFELEGTDECMCRLQLDPNDPDHQLKVILSDPASILGITISVWLNSQLYQYTCCEPIDKICRMKVTIPIKNPIGQVQCFESSKELKDTLTIVADFVITRSEQPFWEYTPPLNVLENVKAMFDTKTFCDVTFVLGDNQLPAHKNILAAQSKVLQAMFLSEMTEKEKNMVEIVDINVEVFEEFLEYFYTGTVNNLHEMVEEMIVVADKYEVCRLKTLCVYHMLRNLTVQNAVRYFLIADKLCCREVKEKALDFLVNRASVLPKALQEADLELLMCLKTISSKDLSKSKSFKFVKE